MPIRPLLAALLLALGASASIRADEAAAEPPDEPPASSERTYPPERIDVPGSIWKLRLLHDNDKVLLEPAERGIILEDPGREPRHNLRYFPDKGAFVHVTLRSHAKFMLSPHTGPVRMADMPVVLLDCTVRVEAAFDDSFELSITIDDVRSEDFRGNLPEASLRAAENLYRGHRVSIIADNRGNITNVWSTVPRNQDWGALSTLDEIARRLLVPLPEEPIGEGAIWNVPRSTQLRPGAMGSEHEVTLRDRYRLRESIIGISMEFDLLTMHDLEPINEPEQQHLQRGMRITHRMMRIVNSGMLSVYSIPQMPPIVLNETPLVMIQSLGTLDTLTNTRDGETSGIRFEHEHLLHITPTPGKPDPLQKSRNEPDEP